MDDYNVNVLSEAKNEYSSKLITILSPMIIEGVRSIFNEACQLCKDNDEEEKYLMTFQNFLSRVPKWNTTIIEEEKNRILNSSGCSYLEDLISCVHITQLKILTSIRVSQKQKKIDIDIPKLGDFIHKCYISFARKLYSNVYLFEQNLLPLTIQKNNREIELICNECILNVTRDSMPIEKILRAYIDKTVDEEIIEETLEKTVEENVAKQIEDKIKENTQENFTDASNSNDVEISKVEKPELVKNKTASENLPKKEEVSNNDSVNTTKETKPNNINLIIETPVVEKEETKEPVSASKVEQDKKENTSETVKDSSVKSKLTFNDTDQVLDLGTNKSEDVNAPKDIERLEQISKIQNEKRKLEEAEEDDNDEETIKIMGDTNIELDNLDIHDINKELKLEPDIILNDIEVLT